MSIPNVKKQGLEDNGEVNINLHKEIMKCDELTLQLVLSEIKSGWTQWLWEVKCFIDGECIWNGSELSL